MNPWELLWVIIGWAAVALVACIIVIVAVAFWMGVFRSVHKRKHGADNE